MKKIQLDKNRNIYMLFRIDIYFNKFLLAVEIDEKGHTDSDFIFEEKDKSTRKKINRRKRNERETRKKKLEK